MRWLILAVGLLVALVVAVFLTGAMLPEGHVAVREHRIEQPVEAVWKTINDHANETKWRTNVQKVERLPDQNGHEVWQETDSHGDKLAFETIEAVPPRRLVREIVADEKSPFSGRWEIELTPAGNATSVKITEKGSVRNPLFRFVSRFVIGHYATMDAYLAGLEKYLSGSGK